MQEPPKRRRTSCGLCALCSAEVGKAQMTRHLEKHRAESADAPGLRVTRWHIVVEGAYSPEYWLHLDIRADTTLKKLDSFLRAIWLECCGHLSQFGTGGGYGGATLGMARKIGPTFTPGLTFRHEYDFGSTTELKIRVLAEHEGDPAKDAVQLLARNTPPAIVCEKCGQPAVWLGGDEEGEYRELCDACAEAGGDVKEWLLPVVNSPRAGVCGYEGPARP